MLAAQEGSALVAGGGPIHLGAVPASPFLRRRRGAVGVGKDLGSSVVSSYLDGVVVSALA